MVLLDVTRLTRRNFISLFLSLQENMYLRHMLLVYGIPYLQNPAGNRLTYLFIDYQGFRGISAFSMLHIIEVLHMIKNHSLVTNKEAILGAIQQSKLKALVC